MSEPTIVRDRAASPAGRRAGAEARGRRAGLLAAVGCVMAAGPARAASLELVSVPRNGAASVGYFYKYRPSVSFDGRLVAFSSEATDLVPGDTNGEADVFVRDRQAGTTERVNLGPGGSQAGDFSGGFSMSGDGRHVAFTSLARLAPDDADDALDVFVRDRQAATTSLASPKKGDGGYYGDLDISPDGRLVAYLRNSGDIFVRNRETASTALVSVGPGGGKADSPSADPSLSDGGRYVAFSTDAGNLAPGDTNGGTDVFVRDRGAGTTTRVSVGLGGAQTDGTSYEPSISSGGRFVAFMSAATNLVPGDTNDATDVFVHDRQTGLTSRVSVGPGGVQGEGGYSGYPSISDNGRFVAFESGASNLVPGDTNQHIDVFVHDRRTGATRRLSVGPGGAQPFEDSQRPAISGDGRHVAFWSAGRLTADVGEGYRQNVFVHSR